MERRFCTSLLWRSLRGAPRVASVAGDSGMTEHCHCSQTTSVSGRIRLTRSFSRNARRGCEAERSSTPFPPGTVRWTCRTSTLPAFVTASRAALRTGHEREVTIFGLDVHAETMAVTIAAPEARFAAWDRLPTAKTRSASSLV